MEQPQLNGDHCRLVVELAQGEIHFLKRQQWLVTNYGLLLYGAIVVMARYFTKQPERCLLAILAVIVGVAATTIVVLLHYSISKARERSLKAGDQLFSQEFLKEFPEYGTKRNTKFSQEFLKEFPEYGTKRNTKLAGVVGVFVSALLTGVLAVGLVLSLSLLLGKVYP